MFGGNSILNNVQLRGTSNSSRETLEENVGMIQTALNVLWFIGYGGPSQIFVEVEFNEHSLHLM